jgi:hypothetical protein
MLSILVQLIKARRIALGLGLLILVPALSHGFDNVITHPQITEPAARSSMLDSFIANNLGLRQGILSQLKGASGAPETILQWLKDGSTNEDIPPCLASNHFHNPLKPFTESAVSDLDVFHLFCGFAPLFSNVTWGTRFTSPTAKGSATPNSYDWDAARTAYFNALVLPSASDREQVLAALFETLGHVLHLIQDLAVPAHARDDFQSHLDRCGLAWPLWDACGNAFEQFVRNSRTRADAWLANPRAISSQDARKRGRRF